MKKLLSIALLAAFACVWISSCSDTETYADLVDKEKSNISHWIKHCPYTDFGHIVNKNEDWVDWTTDSILSDSLHPSQVGIKLNQWYCITEGNFKRLYFCIHNFGNDGLDSLRQAGIEPTAEQYRTAMRNKKKFYAGKNVLVRYDSLYLLNDYDYDSISANSKGDNLDPISYSICYNWNASYYSTSTYSYYYSTSSSYECTSGGLAYPVRYLWEGGEASIICPFSLVESTYSSYYYTLYYGVIRYTKPNYLPQ